MKEFAYRIEMWGDEIEQISIIKPVSGDTIKTLDDLYIYPAKHFVMPETGSSGRSRSSATN